MRDINWATDLYRLIRWIITQPTFQRCLICLLPNLQVSYDYQETNKNMEQKLLLVKVENFFHYLG